MQQDRLAELRRQRALVADHLAWLDHEIAATGPAIAAVGVPIAAGPANALSSPPASPATTAAARTTAPASTPAALAPAASPILGLGNAPTPAVGGAHPAEPPAPATEVAGTEDTPLLPELHPAEIKDEVRRGCLLYFALAALLVIGGGALLIWAARAYKEKHPPAARIEAIPESQ